MFESVLEKILLKYCNTYIKEFDKNCLKIGLWNGDIEIQNVQLNSNILEKFDFPFLIQFSFIKNIKIKIPWTKLASIPIIIILEDIFLFLKIKEF